MAAIDAPAGADNELLGSPGAGDLQPGKPAGPAKRPLGRPFGAQLATTGLANLGDGLLGTLTPLLALGLTTSPAQISLLSAATWLPWLLFALAAGVLIDRVDRRRAQIAALSVRAALLAGAAGLAAAGMLSMPILVALALTYGITEVVADLGATAILPDLVRRDQLAAANGRIVAVQQLANGFLGAPLAGALIVTGAAIAIGTTAGLVALAALILLIGMRGSFRATPPAAAKNDDDAPNPSTATSRALAEVRDGLRFVWHHPVVRPMVMSASLLNLASTGYMAVYVLWLVGPGSHVGLTEQQYPLLMLGFAVGAVGGSFLAPVGVRLFGEWQTIIVSLVLNSLLLIAIIPLTSGIAVAVGLATLGAFNAVGNVTSMAMRQRIVPRALLGRVGGASRTLAYGLMPVGAILGGLVAEQWGLVATFVGAGAISLGACAYLALSVRPAMVTDAEAALEAEEAEGPRQSEAAEANYDEPARKDS